MERWTNAGDGYLEGHLLIAMPGMADPRFARAVIYLCAHSPDGAMGIRINQAAAKPTFPDVLASLKIRLPRPFEAGVDENQIIVHNGGPVEAARGFVLHSADYVIDQSTILIDDELCLTASISMLEAIAAGRGPEKAILALGYAGWGPGQLEKELRANGWLSCPARPELVFDPDLNHIYDTALAEIGINPAMLSSDAGSA